MRNQAQLRPPRPLNAECEWSYLPLIMTSEPSVKPELEDPWFVEPAPDSTQPPALEDPELDGQWFARGRPLSSRPPPPDTEV